MSVSVHTGRIIIKKKKKTGNCSANNGLQNDTLLRVNPHIQRM